MLIPTTCQNAQHCRSRRSFAWIVLFLTILFPYQCVLAADDDEQMRWYQIEVVVFANLEKIGVGSEQWSDYSNYYPKKIIDLVHPKDQQLQPASQNVQITPGQAANMPTPYELLDSSQLQLVPIVKKLEASRSYQPLLHIAWRQPTVHPDEAPAVAIFDNMTLAVADDPEFKQTLIPVQSVNSNVGLSTQYNTQQSAEAPGMRMGPKLNTLSGTLKLGVSRYLHLEVNLHYRAPILKEEIITVDPMANSSGFDTMSTMQTSDAEFQGNGMQHAVQTYVEKRNVLQDFHLLETRRMRSKEVHYFDHPMISVITRVVPYEVPKLEPDFDPASQAFTSGNPAKEKEKANTQAPKR